MGKRRDWKQYNKQLVNRGKIHFWINPEVIKNWKAPERKKNGHPFLYSDRLIQIISYIRFKFCMSLRETEGFFSAPEKPRRFQQPTGEPQTETVPEEATPETESPATADASDTPTEKPKPQGPADDSGITVSDMDEPS